MGCDLFEILLLIAKGDFNALYPDTMDSKPNRAFVPLDTRMKAATEAAKYVYPNLKSVEHTGQDGNPLEILMKLGESGLEQRLRARAAAWPHRPPDRPGRGRGSPRHHPGVHPR